MIVKEMINVPDPDVYGISPKLGFLSKSPLSFEDPYYEPWDSIIAKLSTLISSGNITHEIEKLPLLSTDKLSGELEYQRAYVVLAFLTHAHVWSPQPPNENVPPQIAEPFLEVCSHIRMEPVISYAGLCSWNWQIRDGGGMELEHLDPIGSFTGTRGEAAFYNIPILVEYEGTHLMHLLLDAIKAAVENYREIVVEALNETAESIVRMEKHLPKFHSTLDANLFYHELRPFFAGGKGMEEKGLPRGMVFQKSDGSEVPYKLVGGSAIQSSFFPFLDYVFGVEHKEDSSTFQVRITQVCACLHHQRTNMTPKEMRAYMPGKNREFLNQVSLLPSLRDYVEANPGDIEVADSYNECLKRLRAWRGKHIAVVSKYIVQPAREAERPSRVERIVATGAGDTQEEWELQGTGGSALIPFLRQARDDTAGVAK